MPVMLVTETGLTVCATLINGLQKICIMYRVLCGNAIEGM